MPGLDGVLGEDRSPLWLTDPSGDACTELLALFRRTDDTGDLVIDFTDPDRDTRFLGDLYQDLSEHAKKTYALLQTPDFVEEFILDRTLDPAIESVGLDGLKLIDPTCGSGHFLLGAFDRLWQRWTDAEPAMPPDHEQPRALDAVWGVDINPFAAAIARFRLLVARAMQRADQTRLADVPATTRSTSPSVTRCCGVRRSSSSRAWRRSVAATTSSSTPPRTPTRCAVPSAARYAAVVGNPPYIVPKDKAAERSSTGIGTSRATGSTRWGAVHRAVLRHRPTGHLRDGSTGGLRRDDHRQLVHEARVRQEAHRGLHPQVGPHPRGRHLRCLHPRPRHPDGHPVRPQPAAGRRHDPRGAWAFAANRRRPADPAKGLVWSAIVDQIDEPGSESDYVSVADTDRSRFAKHPWSIGGGGAAELKERSKTVAVRSLSSVMRLIGDTGRHTGRG